MAPKPPLAATSTYLECSGVSTLTIQHTKPQRCPNAWLHAFLPCNPPPTKTWSRAFLNLSPNPQCCSLHPPYVTCFPPYEYRLDASPASSGISCSNLCTPNTFPRRATPPMCLGVRCFKPSCTLRTYFILPRNISFSIYTLFHFFLFYFFSFYKKL